MTIKTITGQIMTLDDERAKSLINQGFAQEVKPEPKKAPAKKKTKKD